jgi:hypothetical protein
MWIIGLIVGFVAGYATALILVSSRFDKLGNDPEFLALLPEKPQSEGWKQAQTQWLALEQAKTLRFIAPPAASRPEPAAKIPVIELPDHPVWIQ